MTLPLSTNHRPVLLIHGIDADADDFCIMAPQLRAAGHEVHVLSYTPSDGRVGLDRLAEQIAAYAEIHFTDSQNFDLVAFSMGGLISRYYIQKLGGADHVRRLITISSPHRGTLTAFFRPNMGGRQMIPRCDFLMKLNADMKWTQRVRWTSLWTPFDLMIVPARSSLIPQAQCEYFGVLLHPWMLSDPRVIRRVHTLLAEP